MEAQELKDSEDQESSNGDICHGHEVFNDYAKECVPPNPNLLHTFYIVHTLYSTSGSRKLTRSPIQKKHLDQLFAEAPVLIADGRREFVRH